MALKNSNRSASTRVSSASRENTSAAATGRDPVRRDEADLVGRLQLVLADQVGHRGFLRRDPEQADALDQERRDEQPPELRRPAGWTGTARTGPMSAATMSLRRSNRSANAPASGPKTTAGSSRTTSTPPRAKFGRRVAVGELGRERRRGQQTQPVTEARERHDQPQPAEVAHPQHGPDAVAGGHQGLVVGGHPSLRVGRAVGVDGGLLPGSSHANRLCVLSRLYRPVPTELPCSLSARRRDCRSSPARNATARPVCSGPARTTRRATCVPGRAGRRRRRRRGPDRGR